MLHFTTTHKHATLGKLALDITQYSDASMWCRIVFRHNGMRLSVALYTAKVNAEGWKMSCFGIVNGRGKSNWQPRSTAAEILSDAEDTVVAFANSPAFDAILLRLARAQGRELRVLQGRLRAKGA